VVLRAISLKRERRYGSMVEMEDELIEALPGLASDAELAEFLHRTCGDAIERQRTELSKALERFSQADSADVVESPALPAAITRNTLSPSYVTNELPPPLIATPLKPGGTALAAAGVAFVIAFALTVILSPTASLPRSGTAAPLVPPVETVPASSARTEAAAPPRAVSRAPQHVPPIEKTGTTPSAMPAKRAPALAPHGVRAKTNDATLVLRRYGI